MLAGALQQEVKELRNALQISEDTCRNLQLMLQRSVKERTELQNCLTSTSKLIQQARAVDSPQKVISWGKSSSASRPQRQQTAPATKTKARHTAEAV